MVRCISLVLLAALIGCDGKDSEYVPEEDPIDEDGDGYPADEDCDDFKATISPGAVEVCDEIDNNCNGEIDEGAGREYYLDEDGDGYGLTDVMVQGCAPPDDGSNYAERDGDCDDTVAIVSPGISFDGCDDLDNDCDGDLDEDADPNDYSNFFLDADGDGFGDPDISIHTCVAPDGYLADSTDCDDSTDKVYPGAPERCNSTDNDCNGVPDDNYVEEWYADSDSDGYGDPDNATDDCDPSDLYVVTNTDCDDSDAATNPIGIEFCDGADNNCNLDIDEHSCYTDWTGDLFYEFGKWDVPKLRDCEIFWDSAGERVGFVQHEKSCPFCEFAFTVDYTYDREQSYDNGLCVDDTLYIGESVKGDLTYDWAFTSTYAGYEAYPVFYIGYYGNWYPYFVVNYTEAGDTLEFDYELGYENAPDGNGNYITLHIVESGTLTE